MDENKENFNRENINTYQIEVMEVKNYWTEKYNSSLDDAEERISQLKRQDNRAQPIRDFKWMKKGEDSLRNLWDNIKWTKIYIIRVPGEENGSIKLTWRSNNWELL